MRHCEELERRAQETATTDNALKTALRQVDMSVQKESEPTEPGYQPRPTPNRGTPRALPVHIEHLEVDFAGCDDGTCGGETSSHCQEGARSQG
jgi:hypothetical protein